ncbi:F-box protein At2g32560 [Amborella trichopoda]|nr:F-box protein At2g32560 [Amborella trichopoda]|eukprot:XP_006836283.2 F-box protein At2g32560 [Amborella trichopoda]
MLLFLLSCLSFLLLSKSLSLKSLKQWLSISNSRIGFFQKSFNLIINWPKSQIGFRAIQSTMSLRRKSTPKVQHVDETDELSVLDLPELVLEGILGRLPPEGLCNMAAICSSMRERCRSNHLWERHMKEKWARVIGPAALKEWQSFVSLRKDLGVSDQGKSKGWIGSLACIWPVSWLKSKLVSGGKPKSTLPSDSIMAWYLSLENGRFWFPAQVYNREHGHVGFMLSCYDAELSYDSHTDTFHARYPPHGRRTIVIEEGVQWDRLRAPPVDTPPHDLHVSDCLNDLRPGNHIEIQWRRNKEFPYGWWYGVVGHLDSCDRNKYNCRCLTNDTVILEFNQYTPGSRWRRTVINRKDHREEGNETDGFYGGIRKLHSKEEISMWMRLWPSEILD